MENVKLGFYFPGGDFLHDFAVIQVEILASGVSPHKANKGKIRYRVRKGEVLWKADPSFKHKGMDEFCTTTVAITWEDALIMFENRKNQCIKHYNNALIRQCFLVQNLAAEIAKLAERSDLDRKSIDLLHNLSLTITEDVKTNSHTVQPSYTSEKICTLVDTNRERLFASYAAGRSKNWSTDQRTRDLVCIGNWMTEEMTRLNLDDKGRVAQQLAFNRASRSAEDLFALASQLMNDVLENKIDRNRIPHRRWG